MAPCRSADEGENSSPACVCHLYIAFILRTAASPAQMGVVRQDDSCMAHSLNAALAPSCGFLYGASFRLWRETWRGRRAAWAGWRKRHQYASAGQYRRIAVYCAGGRRGRKAGGNMNAVQRFLCVATCADRRQRHAGISMSSACLDRLISSTLQSGILCLPRSLSYGTTNGGYLLSNFPRLRTSPCAFRCSSNAAGERAGAYIAIP